MSRMKSLGLSSLRPLLTAMRESDDDQPWPIEEELKNVTVVSGADAFAVSILGGCAEQIAKRFGAKVSWEHEVRAAVDDDPPRTQVTFVVTCGGKTLLDPSQVLAYMQSMTLPFEGWYGVRTELPEAGARFAGFVWMEAWQPNVKEADTRDLDNNAFAARMRALREKRSK